MDKPMSLLRIDAHSPVPIWSQIEEALRHLIAAGRLSPGIAVPSVRDLARELRINPATVSKAYQRLTEAGVLEVRRGDGTYVASAPPAIGRADRNRMMRDGARRLAGLAMGLGASCKETTSEVEAAWAELEPHPKTRSER
jgi:GntR family transcriptional regulator